MEPTKNQDNVGTIQYWTNTDSVHDRKRQHKPKTMAADETQIKHNRVVKEEGVRKSGTLYGQ